MLAAIGLPGTAQEPEAALEERSHQGYFRQEFSGLTYTITLPSIIDVILLFLCSSQDLSRVRV